MFFTANRQLHARPAAASVAHVVGFWLSAAIAVTLIFVPAMVIAAAISLHAAGAHVISKRALLDHAAWQDLIASCRRWHLSAREGSERRSRNI